LAKPYFRLYNVENFQYTWIELIMIRNLLASAILLASTSTFATIAEDVANKVSASEIVESAVASCETSACVEAALTEMLKAGLTLEAVADAATKSGVDQASFNKAATSAGIDINQAFTAFTNATNKTNSTAGGNKPAATNNKKPALPTPFVPAGTEPSSISPAG
jgi:hypothetical protein